MYDPSMRFWSRLTLALGLMLCTGCESAKITDLYMSRDAGARRRTDCFKPEWKHYFVFLELFSASEETIVTPRLRDGGGNLLPVAWKDEELAEFENWAPGEGDNIILNIEVTGPEDPNDSDVVLPLTPGNFSWEFYLDDHSDPDDRVEFAVSDLCP